MEHGILKSCCISSIFLLLALFIVLSFSQPLKELKNIDFIGVGYDVMIGNPHSRDEGFRRPVVDLTYDRKSESSDGRWLIPDNIQALQFLSCDLSVSSEEVTNITTYTTVIEREVAVYVKTGLFRLRNKFSHNQIYRDVQQSMTKYHRRYIESTAYCITYATRIKGLSQMKVTSEFIQAVEKLPTTRNDQTFINFIVGYGTHFVVESDMGSKQVVQSEFTEQTWIAMKKVSYNYRAGAQASFYQGSNPAAKEYEKKRTSYKETYMGTHPPSDGNMGIWAKKSSEDPYPVAYKVWPITDLLTTRFIVGHNESELKTKQQLLETAIDRYCDDKLSISSSQSGIAKMDKVQSIITGSRNVYCPIGYSLLSCGIDNTQTSRSDHYRYAAPMTSIACQCHDTYGALCVAWCSQRVNKFEIVSVSPKKPSLSSVARCPVGKKVIGCHVQTSSSSFNQFYPSRDGLSCSCYTGGYCVATCASNIINYEVKSTYFTGFVTVFCTSSSNTVLGCGIQPSSSSETFRAVHVSSTNSCYCYDRLGATCYAICGKV